MSQLQQKAGLGACQEGNSHQVWVRLKFPRSFVYEVSGFSLEVAQRELSRTKKGKQTAFLSDSTDVYLQSGQKSAKSGVPGLRRAGEGGDGIQGLLL